jgi:hypothetical protein
MRITKFADRRSASVKITILSIKSSNSSRTLIKKIGFSIVNPSQIESKKSSSFERDFNIACVPLELCMIICCRLLKWI